MGSDTLMLILHPLFQFLTQLYNFYNCKEKKLQPPSECNNDLFKEGVYANPSKELYWMS